MIDLIIPKSGFEFIYGIPIAIFLKNRGENGFNLTMTYTDANNKNKFYIALGFAPKNDFSNFERLTDVDCKIFYVSKTLIEWRFYKIHTYSIRSKWIL